MEIAPTVENAATWFNAKTVTHHLDVVDLWPEEGLDKRSVAVSSRASVEIKSEVGAVSMVDETHTGVDKITSFFEDETSDEPWLVIVEPN